MDVIQPNCSSSFCWLRFSLVPTGCEPLRLAIVCRWMDMRSRRCFSTACGWDRALVSSNSCQPQFLSTSQSPRIFPPKNSTERSRMYCFRSLAKQCHIMFTFFCCAWAGYSRNELWVTESRIGRFLYPSNNVDPVGWSIVLTSMFDFVLLIAIYIPTYFWPIFPLGNSIRGILHPQTSGPQAISQVELEVTLESIVRGMEDSSEPAAGDAPCRKAPNLPVTRVRILTGYWGNLFLL